VYVLRTRLLLSTGLADTGEMAAKTNQIRAKTTGTCSYSCAEDDVGGLDEEDSNANLVTTGVAPEY
jgi:hypothetical protein